MTDELIESKISSIESVVAELMRQIESVSQRVDLTEAKLQVLDLNGGRGDAACVSPVFGECQIPQITGDTDGCFELSISKNGQSYTGTLRNPYYRVGGKTYVADDYTSVQDGILCLEIDASTASPESAYHTYDNVQNMQAAEQDMSKFICPLYTVANGSIVCDWRKGSIITMTEF